MTHQQEQRCSQEIDCMECPSYCEDNEIPCPLHNCNKRDTHIPPLPVRDATELPDDYWKCPFIDCQDNEPYMCDWPCDRWAKWHDTAVAAGVRKEVLDIIDVFAHSSSRLVDLDGECGDESSDMVDADELKVLIESLRPPTPRAPAR
jgi:hypothetical protein